MHATLQSQRWPLVVLLAVFLLALMAALAPGLSELDLSGIEPPIRGMERAVATR